VANDVYGCFIEELDAMTNFGTPIMASDPVAAVVGRLTRAVKRAQMVHDGRLLSPVERGWAESSPPLSQSGG
jgi:hypothetical protein